MNPLLKIGSISFRPFVRNGMATGRWQVDIPPNLTLDGKRRRAVCASKPEAEALARSTLTDVRLRGSHWPTHEARSDLTLVDLLRAWIADQELRVAARKKKASSLSTNLNQLKNVFAVLAHVPPERLSEANLTRYQAQRLSLGRRPETVNSEVATFLQFLSWARKREVNVPAVNTDPIPVQRKSPALIEPHEASRVVQHLFAKRATGCNSQDPNAP